MFDFIACCRLCLKKNINNLVNCLEVTELSDAVKNLFGFQISEEDNISTKICRDCIYKVTNFSIFRDSVLSNQKSIEQYKSLQSKIMQIREMIKTEEDDDVVFISSEPAVSSTSEGTNEPKTSEPVVDLIQNEIPTKKRKQTARKSTATRPTTDISKPKIITKKLKVVCLPIAEEQVKDIYLPKRTRRVLKVHGKKKIHQKTMKKIKLKEQPPLRIKLKNLVKSMKPKEADHNKSNTNPTTDPSTEPEKSNISNCAEDTTRKILIENNSSTNIQETAVKSISVVNPTNYVSNCTVIHPQMPANSTPKTSQIKFNITNPVWLQQQVRKTYDRQKIQINAIQPLPKLQKPVQPLPTNFPIVPLPGKNNVIIRRDENTGNIKVQVPRIKIVHSAYGSANAAKISTQTSATVTATTVLPATVTAATTMIAGKSKSPVALSVGPYTQFVIEDKLPVDIYMKEQQEMLKKQQLQNSQTDTTNCSIIDSKLKILTVSEVNMRADPMIPSTSNDNGMRKLPIRITLVKVRNEIQIKLTDSSSNEIHYNSLTQNEISSVRNSLMQPTSITKLERALSTCAPCKYSQELLKTIGLSLKTKTVDGTAETK